MNVPYVDIGAQYLKHRDEILNSVDAVLASGQYILGPELEKFESQFAELCQTKHAFGCANGTDSLVIAMKALGIGEGDEVITAPNSWISSASSIALAGAKPVFCDVGEDQNIDPTKIEKRISKNTKAIMPVHLTGKISDMDAIMEIANNHQLAVIEDAAQAAGAQYKNRMAGSIGTIGCFSLHPLKNLNGAGDGGAIVTNDSTLANQIKLYRNHGIVHRSDITQWGYNSRLDCIQAAILNIKLKYLDEVIGKRRAHAKLYQSILSDIVTCPQEENDAFDTYHLYVIQCNQRDELQEYLKEAGIQTAIHYPTPIHLYDCSKYLGYKQGDFPVTEKQSQRILSLPIHQDLNQEQIQYTANTILQFYDKSRNETA